MGILQGKGWNPIGPMAAPRDPIDLGRPPIYPMDPRWARIWHPPGTLGAADLPSRPICPRDPKGGRCAVVNYRVAARTPGRSFRC